MAKKLPKTAISYLLFATASSVSLSCMKTSVILIGSWQQCLFSVVIQTSEMLYLVHVLVLVVKVLVLVLILDVLQ